RQAFYDMFDTWAEEEKAQHPEATDADWAAFRQAMYGGDNQLFCVDDDFLRSCPTPLLVMLGNDLYHPERSSRHIAALAPKATLVEQWKAPEHHEAARRAMDQFLAEHTPT